MTEKKVLSKKERIREMTIIAMFIAIIFVMGFVPQIGFVTIFAVSATLIHIPVLIGGALLGRKAGMILGLAFGTVSLLRGAMSGGYDFLFIFPWVSILPRLIFGLLIYDVYKFFERLIKIRVLALAVSFFILTLLHSAMVLPMMISTFPLVINVGSLADLVGAATISEMQGVASIGIALKVIWGILITNSILEALLAATIGALVADRLIKYLRVNQDDTFLKGVKNESSN